MQISPSPSFVKSEDDQDPMLVNLPKTTKTETVAKHIKNQSTWLSNRPFAQSKSGIRKANELLAKERAFKAEYLPPDVLLPPGIKNIEQLKKIRQSQKNHKTKPRSTALKFDGEDLWVEKMIVSADSNFLIAGTLDGTIIIHDIQQNKIHCRFNNTHKKMIRSLTFGGKENRFLISSSDDGSIKFFDWMAKTETNHSINTQQSFVAHTSTDLYLAAADDDTKITLYNLNNINSKPLHTFEDEYQMVVAALAINKDNTHLYSCGDFHIKIHDIKTYELIHTFEDAHEDYLTAMVLSSDSKLMVSGSDDLSIKVWDLTDREELHQWEHVHSDNIKTVLISSDKKSIISCCQKGSIKVLNIDEGLVVHGIHTQSGDTVIALAPEDQFLLTAENDQVNFWEFESGRQFSKDKSYNPELFTGENVICPNSKFFVHYDSFLQNSENQPVKVHNIESGETFDLAGKIAYHNTSYLAVSPNGEYVISYSNNGDIGFIYYPQQDKKIEIQIYGEINSLKISPDSQYLIYATYDSVRFIDVSTQKECRAIEGVSEYQIQNMKVSPNGGYLVVSTADWSIIVVDLITEEIFPFKGAHDNKIHEIAISFDGKFFASASQDTSIKVFDFQTKQLIHKFVDADETTVNAICFSPDNRYLVSGFDDVKFYDLETKSHVLTIINHAKKDGYTINDVAISPNGQKLWFFPCKGWIGSPLIYHLNNSHPVASASTQIISPVSDEKQSSSPPAPKEQDILSYSCFNSYYTKFNSIEESLLRRNRPKAEIFSKIIQSNFYILPYSWNILHIAAIESNDTFIKDMPAYSDFKISFLLDRYGKTPLHYLVAQEKITYSSVNIMLTYICDYLDDCANEKKYEYQQVIKSLNPLCWFILLKCDVGLRGRFLNLCLVDSPTPFKMELPVFGEPTSTNAYFTQSPEVTPQIQETICEEGQNQIQFKTNLLYLDYDVTSEDMGKTIECLIEQDSDDLFRSQIVSKLLNHLWDQAKPTLMILFVLFSVFMICLSVYIAEQERILAFEIVILAIAGTLLVAEVLQVITATMDYVTDPWNVVDVVQILLTIAFIITRFNDDDNDLARSWMSTVIILAGYFRWVSYLRVFKPIRNFMQIFGSAVKDMWSFMIIIALIVIGFSIAFVAFGIGNETAKQWGPYGAYLYNAYLSFYGAIGDPDYGAYDLSQKILIALIAFLLNVILLNLLISILGESYGNSVATRDKTETLAKFEMILEAVTFMKIFNRKRKGNVLRKSYLIYCFTSKSEAQGNPEGEMEIRIGKKFVDLKEDFAERLENMESNFNETKASEEKLEKLTAQVAHLKEFYLRAIGIKEYADLKKKYKDFPRLEKKIETDIQKEDDEGEEDEEESYEESVAGKK